MIYESDEATDPSLFKRLQYAKEILQQLIGYIVPEVAATEKRHS